MFRSAITGQSVKLENIKSSSCGGVPGVLCSNIPAVVSEKVKQ